MHIYVSVLSVLRLKGLGLFHLQGRLLNKREGVCYNCLFIVSGTVGSSPAESVVTKGESNQSGESLLPETAQLLSSLSSLQPKIFAQLQVQSSCLQNVRCSVLGVLKASWKYQISSTVDPKRWLWGNMDFAIAVNSYFGFSNMSHLAVVQGISLPLWSYEVKRQNQEDESSELLPQIKRLFIFQMFQSFHDENAAKMREDKSDSFLLNPPPASRKSVKILKLLSAQICELPGWKAEV